MKKSADISECGKYRYLLRRMWAIGDSVLFIMLNPSIADASIDDPTIRRCIGFAKGWGYGSISVCNLYAYRATNPDELDLLTSSKLVGIKNGEILKSIRNESDKIIVAWGTKGGQGSVQFRNIFNGYVNLYCFGFNRNGSPKHPLYIKKDTELISWTMD